MDREVCWRLADGRGVAVASTRRCPRAVGAARRLPRPVPRSGPGRATAPDRVRPGPAEGRGNLGIVRLAHDRAPACESCAQTDTWTIFGVHGQDENRLR